MRLFPSLALFAALVSGPVLADDVTGKVLTFDAVSGVLVLTDHSSWSLQDGGVTAPDGLKAGDTVTITYVSAGENGFDTITDLSVQE